MGADRDPAKRGVVAYPNNLAFNRKIYESVVCPMCGDRKSRGAMACWWCTGQPEPKSRTSDQSVHTRTMTALYRNHPSYRTSAAKPTEDEVIYWAQQQPKSRILGFRNLGARCYEWLMQQQVQPPSELDPLEDLRRRVRELDAEIQSLLDAAS